MNNQFSQNVTELLSLSKEEAERLKSRLILPEHLLLGMLRYGGRVVDVLTRLGVNIPALKNSIENDITSIGRSGIAQNEEVSLSTTASRIMKISILESRLLGSQEADIEHVLLAIIRDNSSFAAGQLKKFHVNYQDVYNLVSPKADLPDSARKNAIEEDEEDDVPTLDSPSLQGPDSRTKQRAQNNGKTETTPALNRFGVDLTLYAKEGKLDPVVGREREIDRLAQILGRRKKNNPILIGEAGVGKSAIVEGLARRIAEEKVPTTLLNKRIVMLDMSLVVAGTKYRGQFEERICSILNELKSNPHIIVFIDEIHTIIGAGSATGSMDAANILKPALARGEMQCIGATTIKEYKQSIEKDGALERRFQKVMVEPSTPEETMAILQNIKQRYEEHHHVIYTQEALEACIRLTQRYITDRCFPDKAIDALDEAGSRMLLDAERSIPEQFKTQEEKIAEMDKLRSDAFIAQNFELATSYRDKQKELENHLTQMRREWINNRESSPKTVDEEAIAKVVSMMSGVPVQRVAQSEGCRLAHLKNDLQAKVIAQDTAIEKVTKAILRSRIGLKDPNRPIGTFLFLGPTGVGKTYLAQQLANCLFGSKESLIRIDMSEYMEKYTVSRLIGAAPGYVGYEEGGQLTEQVRRRPYSIILLDEIEKANPEVFNILLQVLDEGRLTDNNGRTVDFRNTVIILTSNVGTRQLKEFGRGIGFNAQSFQSTHGPSVANDVIQKALNKTFSPEFLNRLDEIITFEQLKEEDIRRIVQLELDKLQERVKRLGYLMDISEEAKNFLATKGYDIQFGARPLKRAIQNFLEDELSEFILTQDIHTEDTIHVSVEDNSHLLLRIG